MDCFGVRGTEICLGIVTNISSSNDVRHVNLSNIQNCPYEMDLTV